MVQSEQKSDGGRLGAVQACFVGLFLLMLFVPMVVTAKDALVGEDSPNKQLLVDSLWLKNHQSYPNVVVVDVRSAQLYQQGHISRAINIPTDMTYRQKDKTDRVASMRYMQELFGAAGIDQQTDVVLYDGGTFIDAGRAFWVFEVYGHRRVAVLDGGYPGWVENGYEISLQVIPRKAKKFVASIRPEKLATRLHARLAMNDASKVLIDARPEEEYKGQKSKASRFGHIPGAVNVPWDRNITMVEGIPMSKTLPELENIYKGFAKDKQIITYCNKGRQSSFTYFVLRRLGRNVSHYDGSWFDWGNDETLPIEK